MAPSSEDPVRSDPVVARVRAMLAARDPDVLAAVDDVDRTLIVSALARDPWERVRESAANARYMAELRRCLATTSKG
jgi:hypothetical protein